MSKAGASVRDKVSFETTLQIRDTCLCLHVHRAARALARRFDDALRPLDLTHGQFSLMNALNRPQSTGMAQAASLLAVDRTTLTAALKPLERRGLVETVVNPKDARASDDAHARRAAPPGEGGAGVEAHHAGLERSLPGRDSDHLRSKLRALA